MNRPDETHYARFVRTRLAALVTAVALVGGGAAYPAPARHGGSTQVHPAAVARTCGKGYVQANLPWGVKCLRAGEFCKVGNPAYRKYGFVCPANGHLRRR